jgi:hypothetical protein
MRLIFWINKNVGECGSFLCAPSKRWQGFCCFPTCHYHLLHCSLLSLPRKVNDDLLGSVLNDNGVSIGIVQVTNCKF